MLSISSDGASAHFKNNASMLNLVKHKSDFGMDACWTFSATGHGKGAGDGIGAVLKSTARRVTRTTNMLLSTAKDFYEFSRQQTLKVAEAQDKAQPAVHLLYLEADEVNQVKRTILEPRYGAFTTTGKICLILNGYILSSYFQERFRVSE